MTTIFERVTTALNTLAPVPFSLAPYKSTGALPDLYMAYQEIISVREQSADDAETERSYLMQVAVFSRSGLVTLPDVDGAMIAAGFEKVRERQLPQDPQTGHYGLAKEYIYV